MPRADGFAVHRGAELLPFGGMTGSRANAELSRARRVFLVAVSVYISIVSALWVIDADRHWIYRVVGFALIIVMVKSNVLMERDHRRAVRAREASGQP